MKMGKIGSVVFFLCVVAFVSGIITGYVRNKESDAGDNFPTDNVQAVIGEEETVPLLKENRVEYYKIKSTDGFVVLYEIFEDKTREEIQRCVMDKSFLPDGEAKILEAGIDFYDKEEALMVMESFIS